MTPGPEFRLVEHPLIQQLVGMGWEYIEGNRDDPSITGRESFNEVLHQTEMRDALRRINLGPDGEPWLDDARISQAVSALERISTSNLVEANQQATELLLKGTLVDGLEGWDQGRPQRVHFIDWDASRSNTFRVVNQYRVNEPGGQAHRFIEPDLVLFVNGIPVAVIEAKSPYEEDPIEKAIDQLHRYSNRRRAVGLVGADEGNDRLFYYNQILVATCFEDARVGTITSRTGDFLEWKDTLPDTEEAVAEELGIEGLSSQQRLAAGLLRPENLLEIIRHFTLFKVHEGRTIKIVARYQQYRAVKKAIDRLLNGKTRRQDGEHDRRGGIIWHTQGSGKSLTMVFLVRMMRAHPVLQTFKVVVVTDRRDLEGQLADTADLTGEPLRVAKSSAKLQETLAEAGSGLVFGLIQKYREGEADGSGEAEFPVLNKDESILVLVDEAHRSHSSSLHANLMNALPNCVRIGFTGTPILMGKKKRTHEIFGQYIDRYTIRQSEEDGSTVPILYEGRTATAAVSGGGELDELFEDLFVERSEEELEAIKRKYATRGHVLEAKKLIEAKARDMLRHYVENVLPNGFKAQVVAVSRKAAIRYEAAFRKAKTELIQELDGADPKLVDLDEEALGHRPRRQQFHARALKARDALEVLEFAPVVSSAHNDPGDWSKWTDRSAIDARIERFKQPYPTADSKNGDALGILIVKSMLLTGFDAPVEQVLYLDRPIREAELLQAIARVNRTYPKKHAGLVVDYYGVAHHLQEALAVYSQEDVEGALRSLKDAIPRLDQWHRVTKALFTERGIDDLDDEEGCLDLLADDKVRAEFRVKLKRFLSNLDLVMPRPEALPYLRDAKRLAHLHARSQNRFRDDVRPLGREVGKKVADLIDKHVVSMGIDPKVPPVELLSEAFEDGLDRERSPKAKASEMEHAIRYHIRKHLNEDPEFFEKLSQRLERIVKELKGQWDELLAEFKKLKHDIEQGRKDDPFGMDDVTARFFGLIAREMGRAGDATPARLEAVAKEMDLLMKDLRAQVDRIAFWRNPVAQRELKARIARFLDQHALLPLDRQELTADRIVELAKANQEKLKTG